MALNSLKCNPFDTTGVERVNVAEECDGQTDHQNCHNIHYASMCSN